MLDHQLAWYVAGPVLGLCVVACRGLFNGRLGVTGGFSELVSKLGGGSLRFDWRGGSRSSSSPAARCSAFSAAPRSTATAG